jgi:dGTPase
MREILQEVRAAYGPIDAVRAAHEVIRRLIARLINDVLAESGARLRSLAPRSVDDVRHAAAAVIGFSPSTAAADRAIKDFLYPRMYRHARIERVMRDAEAVVCDLFAHYAATPRAMPSEWAPSPEASGEAPHRRQIADFIAGMTDRYALIEHARLFEHTPELR